MEWQFDCRDSAAEFLGYGASFGRDVRTFGSAPRVPPDRLVCHLIVPAAASAEVVRVSESVSNLATSPSFQTAEGDQYGFAAWTPTLNLAQFDPSLGQLVGITVTIQTGLANHLLLTGYTPQHLPQAYGACTFQLDWTCSISAPGAMVIPPDSRSGSGTVSAMLGYSQTSVFAAAPLLLGRRVARRRRR